MQSWTRSTRSSVTAPMARRPPGESAARPSPRRPRPGEDLPLHALPAGRLSLPAPAELFGIRRRGAGPLWPVGRLMDDARAPAALSSVGHLRHRPRTRDRAAGRAMVRTLALRALVLGSARGLSQLLEPLRRLAGTVFG